MYICTRQREVKQIKIKIKNEIVIESNDEQKEFCEKFGTIVGIDQATNSGICVISKNHTTLYKLTLTKTRKGSSLGRELKELGDHLVEMNISAIAYERISGRFKHALIMSGHIVGAILAKLEPLDILTTQFSASEIKKFATGNGRASKEQMILAAHKIGYPVVGDDEADALFIALMLKEKLKKDNR